MEMKHLNLYYLIFIINNLYSKFNLFYKTIYLSINLFIITVGLRYAFETISIDLFISNPLIAVIYRSDETFVDSIKSFFSN